MNLNSHEIHAVTAIQATPRLDLYAGIHKAARALMADTLLAVGRMDSDDALELAQTSQRVLELLDFCAGHLRHENAFVHAAMEARAPGASATIEEEHVDHGRRIADLESQVRVLLRAQPAERSCVAFGLYQQLSLFVAENLHHMHEEETAHNAVLWAHYSDAELAEVHNALVASIAPEEMLFIMRWLVPFMNPGERVAMLADMQAHAPAPVLQAVLDTARPHMTDIEWGKLAPALGLPTVAGLVQ